MRNSRTTAVHTPITQPPLRCPLLHTLRRLQASLLNCGQGLHCATQCQNSAPPHTATIPSRLSSDDAKVCVWEYTRRALPSYVTCFTLVLKNLPQKNSTAVAIESCEGRHLRCVSKPLAETAGAMKVADGLEPDAVIGSLIDMKAVGQVEAHIADAVKKGAKVVTGGKRSALGGTFFEPTVLTDVTTDMVITKEETFGPVAPLYRFKSEEDAVKMANDTEFGLASYFYSRDIGRIWRVAEALEYGIVGINEGIISTEIAPFGGMKESGIGREGSKYGIEEFLEVKYLCMGGIDR